MADRRTSSSASGRPIVTCKPCGPRLELSRITYRSATDHREPRHLDQRGLVADRGPGAPIITAGFENLETTLQYQLLKDNAHELAMLLGLAVEWGGTGATNAGIGWASVLTPTFSFGQGFGQLPDTIGWARPLAVTGQIGYQIPTMSYDVGQGAFIPQVLVYGASVQYSMPYLKAEVKDLHLAMDEILDANPKSSSIWEFTPPLELISLVEQN